MEKSGKSGKSGVLVLGDGSVYYGAGFGASALAVGEIVFNTSMTGYQEALTDPSYAGQILTLTYPLIGNYGVSEGDFESDRIHAEGFVVREACASPVHAKSRETIDEFLKRNDVPGIAGIDTRALVRKIRNFGVMPACIAVDNGKMDVRELLGKARALDYSAINFVESVSHRGAREFGPGAKTVVLIDCGAKMSIVRELVKRDARVVALPHNATEKQILRHEPDGIVISNGPGDPARLGYIARTVRALMRKLPVFGICLGNQILAYAGRGRTYKLKFGHRGSNHPVKDLKTGKVYITSQNHGFAVDAKSLPHEFEVTHINCNDGTVEGIRHKELPARAVQYHPEANPGPYDSGYLFDEFVENL